ncbi:MAG: phosphoribosylamine--glycine ligase [Spirochaetaceae bacterium]|nr:phosphoribosylamine--glycine ligase [Spirochaetaceae bacterium]
MKVLVLGSGAREHALVWKFSQSTRISGLFAAPGNAGTEELATNLPGVDPLAPQSVVAACRENGITHVFVGPEEPLTLGVADALQEAGIAAIGAPQKAAQLEGSKAFSKAFMLRNNIPTADYREFCGFREASAYIKECKKKIVLKKSGLAAGKGVLETEDKGRMLKFADEVLRSDKLVIEEFLEGCEATVFAVCDGENYILLPPCADFKKAGENDTGPNTGGMGSICPVPWLDAKIQERIRAEAVEPTFAALRKEGLMYKGILYFGLMITSAGPKILEYNVRFGDPETQALLPVISSDFGNLCDAICSGTLDRFPLEVSGKASLGVVIAAKGYPGSYDKKIPVSFAEKSDEKKFHIFHASTLRDAKGTVLTNGGRCFTVVATGKDIYEAAERAYAGVNCLSFKGAWYRPDIGKRFMTD